MTAFPLHPRKKVAPNLSLEFVPEFLQALRGNQVGRLRGTNLDEGPRDVPALVCDGAVGDTEVPGDGSGIPEADGPPGDDDVSVDRPTEIEIPVDEDQVPVQHLFTAHPDVFADFQDEAIERYTFQRLSKAGECAPAAQQC